MRQMPPPRWPPLGKVLVATLVATFTDCVALRSRATSGGTPATQKCACVLELTHGNAVARAEGHCVSEKVRFCTVLYTTNRPSVQVRPVLAAVLWRSAMLRPPYWPYSTVGCPWPLEIDPTEQEGGLGPARGPMLSARSDGSDPPSWPRAGATPRHPVPPHPQPNMSCYNPFDFAPGLRPVSGVDSETREFLLVCALFLNGECFDAGAYQ